MTNVYLGTLSSAASSIGYGGGSSMPLTINSTAGVQFCNNGGTQLGNSCSISSGGVFNCSGLTISGPLTCSSLSLTGGTSGYFICSSTLNMNGNAITGVTNLNSITLSGSTISGVTNLTLGGKTITKIDFGAGNGVADSVTAASNPNVYRIITFPSGPFTSIPVVTCTATYPVTNYGPIIVTISLITTTNFTFACSKGYTQDNTFAQYTNVQWVAIN